MGLRPDSNKTSKVFCINFDSIRFLFYMEVTSSPHTVQYLWCIFEPHVLLSKTT